MTTRQIDNVKQAEPDDASGLCGVLPWYLNGTVPPAQVRELDAHLRTCVRCQQARELWSSVQHQRRNEPVVIGDVEAALRTMEQRLDRYESGTRASRDTTPAAGLWQRARAVLHPPRLAAVLALLLVAGIGVTQWRADAGARAAPYKTLSDTSAPAVAPAQQHRLRILFHRDTTDARMQAIFNTYQAQVVAGPTARGVYTVVVPAQEAEPRQIAEDLRRVPEVLVAEWISAQ